jgi:hypothetical protein
MQADKNGLRGNLHNKFEVLIRRIMISFNEVGRENIDSRPVKLKRMGQAYIFKENDAPDSTKGRISVPPQEQAKK